MAVVTATIGPTGPRGATGPQGLRGFSGVGFGATGAKGATGVQGAIGQTGAVGPTGAASTVVGPTGPRGHAALTIPVTAERVIYVNKGGNDTIGDGTEDNPVLTLAKAMTLVPGDASPTKWYTVSIGPGSYLSPENDVALKANIQLTGKGYESAVAINSVLTLNDSSWHDLAGVMNQIWFDSITLTASNLFDLSVTPSVGAIISMRSVLAVYPITVKMYSPYNVLNLESCIFQSPLTLSNGGFMDSSDTYFSGITTSVGPDIATPPLIVFLFGGVVYGDISITHNNAGVPSELIVFNTPISGGPSRILITQTTGTVAVSLTPSSAPDAVVITGAASVTYTNNLGYGPAASPSWPEGVPSLVPVALDVLAARTLPHTQTVSASVTGPCVASKSIEFTRVGKEVTAYFVSWFCTSTTSVAAISAPATTVPSQFLPREIVYEEVVVRNGGTTPRLQGLLIINADGSINLSVLDGTSWAASGSVGMSLSHLVTYLTS